MKKLHAKLLLWLFLWFVCKILHADEVREASFIFKTNLSDFTEQEYFNNISLAIPAWEKESMRQVNPGIKGRIALKIYSNSGTGIETPKNLVRAMVRFLKSRGWHEENIFIFDADTNSLRVSGYLPPISTRRGDFEGISVFSLSDDPQSKDWFYESSLPPWESDFTLNRNDADEEGRKSYLPYRLLSDVDFWINMPVVTDHSSIGINGVLANSSLWLVTNRDRFWRNPINAAVAVAEIAAIPELRSKCIFNILSLERYQYVGGPKFNSRYTKQEPMMLLSSDPVALDTIMLKKINRARSDDGFDELRTPSILTYAASLNLGTDSTSTIKIIEVN